MCVISLTTLLPDLMIMKMADWQWALLSGTSSWRKEGIPASASSVGALSGSESSPSSCCRLSAPLSEDVVLSESSSSLMTVAWAQILYVAGYPVHQNRLWTSYFGHHTPAELHGTSTLQRFDPHAFSDLVQCLGPGDAVA